MSSAMPELGSKISLISKADIRYEGRLFTVDPQECTIALANVRSFGTEDRETQYPVAPQSQVYDYILFRGSDIKDIRVLNNVPAMPNDPAIMQMSVPPTLGTNTAPGQFAAQFNHPVIGQTTYPQYHPMAGFPGSVHGQLNKTSELSPQTSVDLASQSMTAPIGSGVVHHASQVKDQGSMLDLIGGGSQQNASRSGTPAVSGHRKSPTADQGTQVGSVASGSGQQRDSRRSSNANQTQKQVQQSRNRTNSRNRQRYPSGGNAPAMQPHHQNQHHQNQHQQNQHQQNQHQQNQHQQNQHQQNQHQQNQHHQPGPPQMHHPHHQPGQGYNRGGWRGRPRGRGRGFIPRNKNTLKFDNDYDFEQANTEFEELRVQLAKTKISEGEPVKPEPVEVDKKDDSGNETGAGEAEIDEEAFICYDKAKSFFDNISCEAVERSKGRSQRTDWRTERKLNSETFGVAMARRGAWRGRGAWRHHNPQHQPMSYYPSWRPMRGGRGRAGGAMNNNGRPRNVQPPVAIPPPQPEPAVAAAK